MFSFATKTPSSTEKIVSFRQRVVSSSMIVLVMADDGDNGDGLSFEIDRNREEEIYS